MDIKETDLYQLEFIQRLYDKKGVVVDLYEPFIPIFLSEVGAPIISAQSILLAIKKNSDQSAPRHSKELFLSENTIQHTVSQHPHLSKFSPLCIIARRPDQTVITQYVPNTVFLESLITNTEVRAVTRLHIIAQLVEYLYWLHSINTHHNDFHDKNILSQSDGRIFVIDYGMSGEKNIEQQRKWYDIHQLNKTIYRLILGSLEKIPEPWAYELPEKEVQRFSEELETEEERRIFTYLLNYLPIVSDDLYEPMKVFTLSPE